MSEKSDFEYLLDRVKGICKDFDPHGAISYSLMDLYHQSSVSFFAVMIWQFLTGFFVLVALGASLPLDHMEKGATIFSLIFVMLALGMLFTFTWAKIIYSHYKKYIPIDTDSTILLLKDEAFKPGRLTAEESAELMGAIKEASYGLRLSRSQCKEINDLVLNYSFNV